MGYRGVWNRLTNNLEAKKYSCRSCKGLMPWVVSLNIEPHSGSRCPGVLVAVAEELTAYDLREIRYNRASLRPEQLTGAPDGSIFTYLRKPEFVWDPEELIAAIPSYYFELVENSALDLEAYRLGTHPPACKVYPAKRNLEPAAKACNCQSWGPKTLNS